MSTRLATADFMRKEVLGGAVLLVAVVVAMTWANLGGGSGYTSFWASELRLGAGSFSLTESLQDWVNDGLMVLFFFVVGLEIKREMTVGDLGTPRRAALPVIAAAGGVVVPALIFGLLNGGGEYARGWAIPVATDIAFAVAVISVLGSRIPSGARIFLMAIAVVDDVIAIAIIAIYYTASIELAWLIVGGVAIVATFFLRRAGMVSPLWYLPLGVLAWIGFLESGVHATVAGVMLGLATPSRAVGGRQVLEELEARLQPWSILFVVPVFALANAGVLISGPVVGDALGSSLFWGITIGLLVGKPIGIGLATLLASRLRLGRLPDGVGSRHVLGVAMLAGIGFTVSIFIAGLSFGASEWTEIAKLGVFAGSLASTVLGVMVLLRRSSTRGPT